MSVSHPLQMQKQPLLLERYMFLCSTSVCVCAVIPFILDVRLVDVPAGVTSEEGHTEFLHLPSAVLALIFLASNR